MPKQAYLAKHFSSFELKEKYLKSRDEGGNEEMAFTVENIIGMDYQK